MPRNEHLRSPRVVFERALRGRGWPRIAAATALLIAVGATYAVAASWGGTGHRQSSPPSRAWSNEAGLQRLRFQTTPIKILPGQNTVQMVSIPQNEKPAVNGYIVSMRPDLHYLDGTVPPVNVIHLHHGVWIDDKRGPFFFGGEEKTVFHMPRGYGYPYKPTDKWRLDQMIHNQLPTPSKVRLVWDIGFIPASTTLAKSVKPVVPVWMDVRGGESYPVFNSLTNTGDKDGTYTYPTDAKNPYGGNAALNQLRMPFSGTIVSAVGHIHPGGLYDTIDLVRTGATLPTARRCSRESLNIADTQSASHCVNATAGAVPNSVRIFRAQAHYYEPAGPVSWDLAMTASRPDWRVRVNKGDTITITTTYENKNIAWYENMGLALLFIAPNDRSGVDPFASAVDWHGVLTHGHLPENNVHGGAHSSIVNASKLRSGPLTKEVRIKGFTYLPGDLNLLGQPGSRIPTVRQGHSLLFVNQDAPTYEWHSITACAVPCNRSTGIAFPLSNAPAATQFDSGQLGVDAMPMGPHSSPATGSLRWSTPTNLKPGTYTYYCRVHPFMRGAFRVVR
jgi:plastocyanin